MTTSYRNLNVWQKAMTLVEEIYRITKLLPDEEMYVLVNQMRRAAVSIPSNIAEGHSRTTDKDFRKFLSIAKGSNSELQTQILICERIGYLHRQETKNALMLTEELGKMIFSLMHTL